MKKRDLTIDILRFIGLTLIIFAHTNPPRVLLQLRNFDVPLMVFISGMSFNYSMKRYDGYLNYLKKRVVRLVVPVWVFLTLLFVSMWLIGFNNKDLEFEKIYQSYLFLHGIGYVWIIRVFLLIAIVSPFIYRICKKDNNLVSFLILSTYLVYELINVNNNLISSCFLVEQYLNYLIPYGVIFYLGLKVQSFSKRVIARCMLSSFIVFFVIGLLLFLYLGYVVPTQRFKYPARLYYISYALFVVYLLLLNKDYLVLFFNKNEKLKDFMLFISQNSIWIYLWHILLLKLFLFESFAVNFLIYFFGAIVIMKIQYNVVMVLKKGLGDKNKIIEIFFLG